MLSQARYWEEREIPGGHRQDLGCSEETESGTKPHQGRRRAIIEDTRQARAHDEMATNRDFRLRYSRKATAKKMREVYDVSPIMVQISQLDDHAEYEYGMLTNAPVLHSKGRADRVRIRSIMLVYWSSVRPFIDLYLH